MGASGLPEMFGALAIDVRAVQSDIAQHAVVELQEQVSTPRPFPPTLKSAHQVGQQSTRSGGPANIAQLEMTSCIDTISMYHDSKLVVLGPIGIKLTQNDSSMINLSP
jgi:hypothetical protein